MDESVGEVFMVFRERCADFLHLRASLKISGLGLL